MPLRILGDQLQLIGPSRHRPREQQHPNLLEARRPAPRIGRQIEQISDARRHAGGSPDERIHIGFHIKSDKTGLDARRLRSVDRNYASDRRIDDQRRGEHQRREVGIAWSIRIGGNRWGILLRKGRSSGNGNGQKEAGERRFGNVHHVLSVTRWYRNYTEIILRGRDCTFVAQD